MKKYDFGGYATKNNLKCSDGRTIMKDAFKHNDGQIVPLVWQHQHNDPANILGKALLENRQDGVYAYCSFNGTERGQAAKMLVEHGDINSLSIYANHLKQQAGNVIHGAIKEVSLVISGANPGALIDNLCVQHGDEYETIEDEAIIYAQGEIETEISHADDEGKDDKSMATEKTVGEVFNTLTEDQKTAVYFLIGQMLDDDDEAEHEDFGGEDFMKHNVFENDEMMEYAPVLSHDDIHEIFEDAKSMGSLKESVLYHMQDYGIENIDVLFPDAKSVPTDPEWIKREDDWVAGVLSAIHHTPFSRVKSTFIDMDIDTARAKGYVKATEKKEVYIQASKRVTLPTTIYVKQKLDRDDIIDITDFDAVAMVRKELRILLNEELARAALIGDGREPEDPYKINEENIRPIYKDTDMFCVRETLTAPTDYKKMIKEIALSHKHYKGSGSPVLYTTPDIHTNMLWVEDQNGRRIYESDATLCAALRVSKIVEIPMMEGISRMDHSQKKNLLAIKVNLHDYNFGADKGGEINTFDDFDIDFNQYKYLMETRCSGALTKLKSAQIYEANDVAAASDQQSKG